MEKGFWKWFKESMSSIDRKSLKIFGLIFGGSFAIALTLVAGSLYLTPYIGIPLGVVLFVLIVARCIYETEKEF